MFSFPDISSSLFFSSLQKELSGIILTNQLEKFEPRISECDKFDDPAEKQILQKICEIKLKKENYDEISQRLETTSTEHVKETNEEATVHGYKILDVGPYNETFPETMDVINGLSNGCNTAGVFFKPNLSTQQLPPPEKCFDKFTAAFKQRNIQSNRDRLKPLYLQAKEHYEKLQIQQSQKGGDGGKSDENTSGKSSSSSSSLSSDVSSSMQTYHEVGNLDELLDRNHQITTMAKVWETSQDVSETSKEAFRRAHLRRTNCLLLRKAEAGEEEEEEDDFGSFGRR